MVLTSLLCKLEYWVICHVERPRWKTMLLEPIWTLQKLPERSLRFVVWKLPHRVIAWSMIRGWANATTGPFGHEEAPGMAIDRILRRWDDRRGGDPSFRRVKLQKRIGMVLRATGVAANDAARQWGRRVRESHAG